MPPYDEKPIRRRTRGEEDMLIDYKDVATMQKFCSPQGKLFDRKRMGTSAKQQRKIAIAVKRARYLGLLRYIGGR